MRDAHILITENDEQIRRSLNIILRQAGFRVTIVSDGKEAVDVLARSYDNGQVDLVLTGVHTPGSTGWESLKRLKQSECNTPILVMIGYRDKAIKTQLIRAGCDCFIEKPFEPDVLLASVRRILSQSENHNQPNF